MNSYFVLRTSYILLWLMFPLLMQGQEVTFTASARSTVGVGETFTLQYVVTGQGTGFRGPSIRDFNVLTGPNTSTSSSIRSVNGRTTMSITYTYTYILQATREGTFDIPAATVVVDQKQYTSNTLKIKVEKGGGGAGTSGAGAASGNRAPQQQGQIGPNDVMLKAFITNANPMQGEGIVVTYKIFTKIPISQVSFKKEPSFPGFWSENLIRDKEKFNQYNQTIDGEQYLVAELRKFTLFPLKAGKITIDPMEVECVAQVKKQTKTRTGDPFFDDFFNDSFFNNAYASVEKSLKSNPLVIDIKPLPAAGKPADFSGAVGNFTFRSEIDRNSVTANDAITLRMTIAGKGNIQLIDKLPVTFPPDFETYDPKVISDIKTSADGISGSQTFEYLLIPRKPGQFTIKPVSFSYYDLSKHTYVTLTSPLFTIDVARGTGENAVMTYAGAGKEEIQYIGSDIRHIMMVTGGLTPKDHRFFGSLLFWLLMLIPALLFIGFVILWRRFRSRRSDTVLMKNLRATRIARKRLQKADGFLKAGQQDPFYEEISQALWGYLSDKFSIPLAELSMDTVRDTLTGKKVSTAIIDRFTETLQNTEFARFAPGEKSVNMERTYTAALDLITSIERELR